MRQNERHKRGPDSPLTHRQEAAILALISQPTIRDAAQTARIGESTLWRWLQQQDFQAAYSKARRESVRQAIARLQNRTGQAVEVLAEIMNDSTANPFARVGAAKAVIEYSIKGVELEDLAERIARLEAEREQ
jgi:hypothetical protein